VTRRCDLDASGSGEGQAADSCDHCNGPSGSIEVGKFLD